MKTLHFSLLLFLLIHVLIVVAQKKKKTKKTKSPSLELNFYTRNVYLGANLDGLVAATNTLEASMAVDTAYETILANDFHLRAQQIAEEIDDIDADIIALQEVYHYTILDNDDDDNMMMVQELDYLSILTTYLSPTYVILSVNTVHAPPGFPLNNATMSLEAVDRDVLLVKGSLNYEILQEVANPFPTLFVFQTDLFTITSGRGYHYLDLKLTFDNQLQQQQRQVQIRVANTHLERNAIAPINEQQAIEFRQAILQYDDNNSTNGTYPYPIIAMGDYNSKPDGSDTIGYQLILGTDFVDTWRIANPNGKAGNTCCYDNLDEPIASDSNVLNERIDYILYRNLDNEENKNIYVRTKSSRLVGKSQFQSTQPRFSSDHVGVVSTIQFQVPSSAIQEASSQPKGVGLNKKHKKKKKSKRNKKTKKGKAPKSKKTVTSLKGV